MNVQHSTSNFEHRMKLKYILLSLVTLVSVVHVFLFFNGRYGWGREPYLHWSIYDLIATYIVFIICLGSQGYRRGAFLTFALIFSAIILCAVHYAVFAYEGIYSTVHLYGSFMTVNMSVILIICYALCLSIRSLKDNKTR